VATIGLLLSVLSESGPAGSFVLSRLTMKVKFAMGAFESSCALTVT
jgi:hypothetical protein